MPRAAAWAGAIGATLLMAAALGTDALADVDTGAIRLRPMTSPAPVEPEGEQPPGDGARRGFDYDSFESRVQTLWFQRKTYLAEGRDADVARQSELIRAFAAEEGVGRLRGLADALIVEARRYLDEGHHGKALASLDLAEALDPGRSQVRFGRAAVYWHSGRGALATAVELAAGVRSSLSEGLLDFRLLNQAAIVFVIGLLGAVALFSALVAARYHVPVRHEVEEWCLRHGFARWGRAAGWLVFLLPLALWFAAGWLALFWIVLCYRFMRVAERRAAIALMALTALAVPAYRVAVGVFGVTTDPMVRTTMDAASGPYSPERIVELRKLVETHPEDATFRFLLAGLYNSGRYFEEAFEEYRRALDLEPGLYQALINVGNIYFTTGQPTEAAVWYLRALETKPDSVLALYNLHLAQAEAFRFNESRESLERAQALDSKRVTQLMSIAGREGERAVVVDAVVDTGAVWRAAIEGGRLDRRLSEAPAAATWTDRAGALANPVSGATLTSIVLCLGLGVVFRRRSPARRCIRCGRAFCHRCKSGREGHEYCSQCIHLFVLGDGLAPESKSRKLYEVERFERRARAGRSLAGLVLPGAGQILRGHVVTGLVFLTVWLTALLAWQPGALRPIGEVLGFGLRLDLLTPGAVPDAYHLEPASLVAMVALVAVWLAANARRLRRGEA